jgi:divalent metal cation (Fe/Co/Zn/Cd) transporter
MKCDFFMSQVVLTERKLLTRTGKRLEYFTIAWNTLEAAVALVAGAIAGSISLIGFGIDSFIEVTSGATLLWRLSVDANNEERERNERTSLRIVGACFVALSGYIAYEAIADLSAHRSPEHSIAGIVLAIASLIVMPLLSRAKRRIGKSLNSAAMQADAKQTEFCSYLSAILLTGLLLNAVFGLWWTDPIAALLMVPIILQEGIKGFRAETCGSN